MEILLAVAGTLFIIWGAATILRPVCREAAIVCVVRVPEPAVAQPLHTPPGDLFRSALRLDRAGLNREEIARLLGLGDAELDLMLDIQPRRLDGPR